MPASSGTSRLVGSVSAAFMSGPLWQARQNPARTWFTLTNKGVEYMLVLNGIMVPSGCVSVFVLSAYTGRNKPPFSKLADISRPLKRGLTFR